MSEYKQEEIRFEFETRQPIKGYPELHWTGKRPYRSTYYYPAQLKEVYGEPKKGWLNKIFWGDNLQVMSHLLKDFRGKVNLIYIDPPFDSKAEYKKQIKVHSKEVNNDQSVFEEKQYGDIWTNDEYLQFMYERIILCKELLSENGSIFLHCDWHKSAHLRLLLDEIFGADKLRNEIAWCYTGPGSPGMRQYNRKHDTILWYTKGSNWIFNADEIRVASEVHQGGFKGEMGAQESSSYTERGKIPEDWWEIAVAARVPVDGKKRMGYPTEKPEKLLTRIIQASSNPGDIVFDCFMGSGTTQAVAMKLGRRFIGADINLGAIQTTTKRLLNVARDLDSQIDGADKYTGFEVYNVNNYDLFRNPIEARDLILQALEVEPYESSNLYDGEKDGRMYKIMPVNRIATKADLQGLLSNLPYSVFNERKAANPNEVVLKLTLVCMGHEPDLAASLEKELHDWKVDIEVVDILRDRQDLQFKRDAEAEIVVSGDDLVIKNFYPLNLMQKLSMDKTAVSDWRQLVESVMIDFNYDGAVMQPVVIDIPEKNGLVKGRYKIPKTAGTIRVKITDVLSESLEQEVKHG